MKKAGVIAILMMLLSGMVVVCLEVVVKNPIESEQEAILLAKEYVLNKYKHSFDDYEIEIDSDNAIWIVSYGIDGSEGGGGPEVHNNKSNGKIIYCELQQ